MASYSISNTSTSVTFTVRGLSAGNIVRIYIRYEPHTGSPVVDTEYTATGSTMTRSFSLSSNRDYVVNVGIDSGEGNRWIGAESFSTEPEFVRFDWTYAGLNTYGNPVYGSTKRSGLGIYVTADEWNELAELVSKGTGKSVSYVVRGQTISASVVNTMARALGVPQVYSEDPISAYFFNRLSSAYNALA